MTERSMELYVSREIALFFSTSAVVTTSYLAISSFRHIIILGYFAELFGRILPMLLDRFPELSSFVCAIHEDGTYRLKKLTTDQYSEIFRRSEDLKMKPLLSKTI